MKIDARKAILSRNVSFSVVFLHFHWFSGVSDRYGGILLGSRTASLFLVAPRAMAKGGESTSQPRIVAVRQGKSPKTLRFTAFLMRSARRGVFKAPHGHLSNHRPVTQGADEITSLVPRGCRVALPDLV